MVFGKSGLLWPGFTMNCGICALATDAKPCPHHGTPGKTQQVLSQIPQLSWMKSGKILPQISLIRRPGRTQTLAEGEPEGYPPGCRV